MMKKSLVAKSLIMAVMIGVAVSACQKQQVAEETKRDPLVLKRREPNFKEAAGFNVELGMRYFKQGNVQRAKTKLVKAVNQAPNWPPALNAMAFVLEKTGEVREAERYYQRALSVAADDGDAQSNYGTFLCRQKRFAQAEKYFMRAALNPKYTGIAQAYENAALCSLDRHDTVKAEVYFQKALLHNPRRAKSLVELSRLALQKERYQEAQQYLKRYGTFHQQTAESLWLSIQVARRLGDDAAVARHTLVLKSKFPKSAQALQLQRAGI